MSTINPNDPVGGSDSTTGEVLAGDSAENPGYESQILDLSLFLFLQNDKGLDGSTMRATGESGAYLLTTQDGQTFKVVDTDHGEWPETIGVSAESPNLILGGTHGLGILGSDEDNKLMGNSGDNHIDGGAGNDFVDGGAGNDYLSGGAGNDTLVSSTGNDWLAGGDGNDRFLFIDPEQDTDQNGNDSVKTSYQHGDDVVVDFWAGTNALVLDDFNGDGVFDTKDYVIEQTDSGALIRFMGAEGVARGSVLLQGVDGSRLHVEVQDGMGQVTLNDPAAGNGLEMEQNQDHHDDDDNPLFFTIV